MYEELKAKMDKAITAMENDFAGIRAGRANAAVLDKISVEYYGAVSPVAQVASISVPDARTIVIQPWDMSLVGEIEKAILIRAWYQSTKRRKKHQIKLPTANRRKKKRNC